MSTITPAEETVPISLSVPTFTVTRIGAWLENGQGCEKEGSGVLLWTRITSTSSWKQCEFLVE